MTTQVIETLALKAASIPDSTESKIPLGFFQKKKKVWIDLLENGDAEFKSSEFDVQYSLKTPYLAHRITLNGAEELKSGRFNIEVLDLDNNWMKIDGRNSNDDKNVLYYDFEQFIKKIRVSYRYKGFGFPSVRLKSLSIDGWDQKGLESLEKAANSYFHIEDEIKELAQNEKIKIDNANAALTKRESAVKAREEAIPQKEQALQQKVSELATQIAAAEASVKEKEAEIKKKTTEVEKATQTITALAEKKEKTLKAIQELEAQTVEKKETLETTKQSVREENRSLQDLLQKKSFYNETLADHKKETNKNIGLNVVLMVLLTIGLGLLTWYVLGFYENSINQIMTVDSTAKLSAIISIRVAAGFIFGYIFNHGFSTLRSMFAKTYHLITDIRNIESKLIVARTVADTALKNSDASPDERRNFSAALSFSVLKNHFLNMSHESIVDDLDVDENEVLEAMPRLPKNLLTQIKSGKVVETSVKSVTH